MQLFDKCVKNDRFHSFKHTVHRKKRFSSFPSPAGMSPTKLPLGRNNSVMTSLFPPRESLVVTSRLGTGNSRSFFLRCIPCCFQQLKALPMFFSNISLPNIWRVIYKSYLLFPLGRNGTFQGLSYLF